MDTSIFWTATIARRVIGDVAVMGIGTRSNPAMFELDRAAGLAFLPYMIWVTIAAALNYRVAQLNPAVAPRDLSAD